MTRLVPIAIALLLLGAAGCSDRGFEQMGVQQKNLPYTESSWFEDGRSMRMPPDGTVPRERELGSREFMTGRDAGGDYVATIPVPLTRAMLEHGRLEFDRTCAACHGVLGDGDSAVAKNMALVRPPPLLARPERRDGFFYAVIGEGHGLMPSYAGQLEPTERWEVVAYLRALMRSQDAPLDDAPPDARGRLQQEEGGARP